VGTDRGGVRRLAEEEEATVGAPVATGGGSAGPPAMVAGQRWLSAVRGGARRLVYEEAAV
jgi:hypothetical protein